MVSQSAHTLNMVQLRRQSSQQYLLVVGLKIDGFHLIEQISKGKEKKKKKGGKQTEEKGEKREKYEEQGLDDIADIKKLKLHKECILPKKI